MRGHETLRVPIDVGRSGPTVVLVPGFGMRPWLYRATSALLAPRARVLVPDVYAVRGTWRYEDVLAAFTATLAQRTSGPVTIVGHSFGGGIELGYAARFPDRVGHAVFADTLAVAREWVLAGEAVRHPYRLLWLATPQAAVSFLTSVAGHPGQLAQAAWWGFRSARVDDIDAVAAAGVPSHVLWANRDSLLSVDDGKAFARDLGATFTVAEAPDGGPIDHDWMYRHPELFVSYLRRLGAVP